MNRLYEQAAQGLTIERRIFPLHQCHHGLHLRIAFLFPFTGCDDRAFHGRWRTQTVSKGH
jgi:hypothetical protein